MNCCLGTGATNPTLSPPDHSSAAALGGWIHKNHCRSGVKEGGGGTEGSFEVLRQPSVSSEPSKGALDHPTTRVDGKADLTGHFSNDLNADGGGVGDTGGAVCTVGERFGDKGVSASRLLQQWDGSVAILNISSMDQQIQGTAIGIDHGMPFSPHDLLPGIVTAWSTCLRGFHRLAVDHGSRRGLFSPLTATVSDDEGVIKVLKEASVVSGQPAPCSGGDCGLRSCTR